jgi:hypothetical protein
LKSHFIPPFFVPRQSKINNFLFLLEYLHILVSIYTGRNKEKFFFTLFSYRLMDGAGGNPGAGGGFDPCECIVWIYFQIKSIFNYAYFYLLEYASNES